MGGDGRGLQRRRRDDCGFRYGGRFLGEMRLQEDFRVWTFQEVQEILEPRPVEVLPLKGGQFPQGLGQRGRVFIRCGKASAIAPVVQGVGRDVKGLSQLQTHARHGHASAVGDEFDGFVELAAESLCSHG